MHGPLAPPAVGGGGNRSYLPGMSRVRGPVVLFDGVCNLCNGSVQFIIDRDRAGVFRFAPLQSDLAATMLASLGHAHDRETLDSVLLVEEGRVYERSDAALRIARRLSFPWSLVSLSLVVPRFLRDGVYRVVAKNRYRWFGQAAECRVPTPELRARFLT